MKKSLIAAGPGRAGKRFVSAARRAMLRRMDETRDERDKRLTAAQYRITRLCGTEAPFSHPYNGEKRPGAYHCVVCGAKLFTSAAKYDSGSGWPSFFRPASAGALRELEDDSHGMRRIEVRCASCDAHLGHVFPDGPRPTGLRFCINGLALDFRPDGGGGGNSEND